MRLVDANILVYAHARHMPQHDAASAWLEERLNAREPLGLPWPTLLAFVRLVTNPRMFQNPVSVPTAWEKVEEWLDRPPVWVPQPGDRHRAILGELLRGQASRANLVPDAHLAALAMEHGLILCSADGDFARFTGLHWQNPLQPSPPPAA